MVIHSSTVAAADLPRGARTRSGPAPRNVSLAWAVGVIALLTLAGCAHQGPVVSDPDFDPEIPGPGSWPMFHAGSLNQGALFVATDFALEPKWSRDVGPVLYSSPVIGGTGRLYLGDVNGRLYAINSLGSPSWTLDFNSAMGSPPAIINSSPAVSDNGAVYVVTTEVLDDEAYRSTLHLVGSDGDVIRSTVLPDGGFTTSSPKIWRHDDQDLVFLYVRHGFDTSSLMVFDKFAQPVAQEDMACRTPVTGTSSVWETIGDILEIFHDAFFDGELGIQFDPSGVGASLHEAFGWLDATVAVVDQPGLSAAGRPLIVLVDKACFFKMFRWEGADLTEVWSERHDFLLQSSPTVLAAVGTIVLGDEDGHLRGYDLLDGQESWDVDLELGPIMGTPASLGGSIAYVAADQGVAMVDTGDGSVLRTRRLGGATVASPALSGNRVYVSTTAGLVSLSLDFRDFVHVSDGRGGLATPAIGKDGTVYVVAADGESRLVRAYGGLPFSLPPADDSPDVLGP